MLSTGACIQHRAALATVSPEPTARTAGMWVQQPLIPSLPTHSTGCLRQTCQARPIRQVQRPPGLAWCRPCRFDLAPCPANHLWLYPVVREYKETHQRADAVLQRAMKGDTGALRSRLRLALKNLSNQGLTRHAQVDHFAAQSCGRCMCAGCPTWQIWRPGKAQGRVAWLCSRVAWLCSRQAGSKLQHRLPVWVFPV